MKNSTKIGSGSRNPSGSGLPIIMAVCLTVFAVSAAGAFERYNSSTNYCGPKLEAYNRTLPNPVPAKPVPGVNFNNACYYHDKCYSECASTCSTQSMCDKEFKARMENICASKNIAIRSTCKDLARTYYEAVHRAGKISYHCSTPPCPDSTTVQPMGTPNTSKAFFFEQDNYAGASVEWSKGTNVADLTKWNTPTGAKWNDRISSIKVGSGVRVLIYEHINFGGRCMTLSSGREYPYMSAQNANLSGSETWNDRVSSLKVTDTSQRCP